MGAVITSDYISSRRERNQRDAISTESTELSLVSSQKKNRGVLPESGEMSCRQKFMQITKFGRDSFATVVGFMMQIGKNTLQPNNPFPYRERGKMIKEIRNTALVPSKRDVVTAIS